MSIVALLVGCSSPAERPPAAPDQVAGVILDIDSQGLGDVTRFTLKDGDNTYEIFIADDVDYGVPLGHLHEHLTSNDPVAVELEERGDGKLYALSIEDA